MRLQGEQREEVDLALGISNETPTMKEMLKMNDRLPAEMFFSLLCFFGPGPWLSTILCTRAYLDAEEKKQREREQANKI
jgi:hypothetical protein